MNFSWSLVTKTRTPTPTEIETPSEPDSTLESTPTSISELEAAYDEAIKEDAEFMAGYNSAKFACEYAHAVLLDTIIKHIHSQLSQGRGHRPHCRGQQAALREVGARTVSRITQGH